MQQPDVFDYTDFRRYLEHWFDWRKHVNPRYSHRMFSRKLGTSDPSLLVNILKGRRKLPLRLLDGFVRVLELNPDAASYFAVLVRLGQARDDAERERAWGELAVLRSRLRKPEIDRRRIRYVSDPLYPTLEALVKCEGFRDDPEWVGAHLRPTIGAGAAAEALDLLEELGLIAREGGRVTATEEVVRSPTNIENFGSLDFHATSLARAGEVLEEIRADKPVQFESAYVASTTAVPTERLADLRALIFEHLQQIVHVCESWPGSDRVVQVSVQMYPVSESTKS